MSTAPSVEARPFPRVPRLIAGAAALAALATLVILEPIGFAQAGCTYSGLVLAASALVLVAFLGLLALAPASLQRLFARTHSPVDLRDAGHVGATIILAATLFFVLGWGGALTAAATLEAAYGHCSLGASTPVDGGAILRDVTLNLAIFTLPVLLFVSFVYGVGPASALRALGLKHEGAARAVVIGAFVALSFLAALAIIESALAPRLPQNALDNAKALEIAKSVTVLGALGLSVASAVGEEVFFRGFLQPRMGLAATAVVFALAHFSYASVSEVVVVFLLALTLGVLYKRTGNLWAPIATHFAFNLINLIAGIYAPTGS